MKRLKVLSLAALVAFAACDEGSEPTPPPVITGTISGVVTIEGASRSGVTVTLSSGATATTDGSGAFSFAGVNAGAYTVTISGFPTDATFSSTTKAATITTAAQVVTVNFDGTYVRTSAISGAITAGGKGLAGVKVSIGSSSVNTGANGIYGFSGLRAGSYTVTISGFDAGQYSFASTTATVTVGVGETKVADFTGQLLATASISGKVTIDGAAAAGVTATLSTGAVATTDAAGAYAFTNLTAGNYTVTISGYPADAQFSSVAKPVVITSAGSTVTADFSGAFVKTSVITGTVTVGGTGLAGVAVSNGSTSVNTDSNGRYSFAALRGGTYTVTISGWDATLYSFATTSASVTVATGESKVQDFGGAYVATAKINGKLFIDELPKNDSFDPAEAGYARSGVTVSIEGGLVNNIQTTTTNAAGEYEFTGLVPGTYRVTITAPAAGTMAFGGASTNEVVVLPPAGTKTVNWPFDIMSQYVKAYAFLGKDADVAAPAGVASGVSALASVKLDLYDTYANATAGTATGRLGQATTDATGGVTFTYARATDKSPAGATDNIVFARFNSSAAPNKSINGETVVEIKYNSQDSLVMAPDTFDFLNNSVILRFDVKDGAGTVLKNWAYAVYRSAADTLAAGTADRTGRTSVTTGIGREVMGVATASIPDTFFVRLAGPTDQGTVVNNHGFNQTPEPATGASSVSRYLRYVFNGTNPDSIMVGTEKITWTDVDLYVRAHNERDDTLNFTNGDVSSPGSDNLQVQLYRVNTDGTKTSVDGPYALNFPAASGSVVFGVNGTAAAVTLPVGTYEVRARSAVGTQTIISDTAYTVTIDGAKMQDTLKTFMASATHPKGYSSFVWKYNNTTLAGTVRAADGTNANGATVRIQTAANFVGPVRDTTLNITAGSYSKTGLLEGPYTVTASMGDSAAVWELLTTVTGNTSPTLASRETQGLADDKIANFQATRLDTKVLGVVINDRDQDLTVIDPDEALAGVTISLYRDGSGTISLDTLVATTTTDAAGAFSFTGLREGRYITKATSLTNAQVLRGLSKDTAVVTTAATTTGSGANNTRVVGSTSPATLPRWDYNNSVVDGGWLPGNYTFLFNNTQVKGTVKTAGGVAVPGMTISLRRCNTSAGATSPPSGAGVCTTYLGSTVNMTSDAAGAFSFTNLIEGVYEVRPQPTTVAGWTTSTPAQILYITVGSADVEAKDFLIS